MEIFKKIQPDLFFAASMMILTLFAYSLPSGVFVNKERKVLGTVEGEHPDQTAPMKVLKVKNRGRIQLEIYLVEGGYTRLLQSLDTEQFTDTFFHNRGRSSNLFLDDIDGDKSLEIIIPSYTDSLAARLEIYKYDYSMSSYIRLQN